MITLLKNLVCEHYILTNYIGEFFSAYTERYSTEEAAFWNELYENQPRIVTHVDHKSQPLGTQFLPIINDDDPWDSSILCE